MPPITAGFHGPAVSILYPENLRFRCNAKQKGDARGRNIYFDFCICILLNLCYGVYIPVMEKASRLSGAGSKLRHWPPGTNSSKFVPFFLRAWRVRHFTFPFSFLQECLS